MENPSDATDSAHHPPSRLTPGQLLRLSSLWFAMQFFWASQQLLVMPTMIERYTSPETLGTMYGLMKSSGAVLVILTQLTVGFVSDHAYSKLGRRRPFIIFGMMSGCAAITLFMLAPDYWWMFAGYMLLEITINIASVPFQSLLPDLVPKAQHSRAGALMGRLHMVGYLVSLIVVILAGVLLKDELLGYRTILLPTFIMMLGGFTILLVLGVDEVGWMQSAREKLDGATRTIRLMPGTVVKFAATAPTLLGCMVKDYLKVELRSKPNFVWLWISRFIVYLGYAAFIQYISLHVRHNLDWLDWLTSLGVSAESAKGMGSVAFAAIMILFIVGGVVGTIASAPLAERYSKKWVIGWGMVLSAIADVPLVLTSDVWVAIGCGMCIGLGWGAFISADWAFACSLMPKGKAGTYMGIWDISTLLPQVISPVLAGAIYQGVYHAFATMPEDSGAEAMAYRYVITALPVYFVIGLWMLRYVKEGDPEVSP